MARLLSLLALLAVAASVADAKVHLFSYNEGTRAWTVPVGINTAGVCTNVVYGGRLPSLRGTQQTCVAVDEASGKTRSQKPVLFSLFDTTTNIPRAVYYALPPPAGVGAARAGNWPAAGGAHAITWAPDNPRYRLNNNAYTRDNTLTAVDTRGHMAPSATFAGVNGVYGEATFTFFNAVPTFNHGQSAWDGRLWNHRETAVAAYARHVGQHQLFVVVGPYGVRNQIRVDSAVAAPNAEVRANLVDVPEGMWTAVYDSKNNRGLAWQCEQRRDTTVAHNKKHPCKYTSIDAIEKAHGVTLFPGVVDVPKLNKSPAVFDPSNWAVWLRNPNTESVGGADHHW